MLCQMLELCVEDLLSSSMSWYEPHMKQRRLLAWRVSGDRAIDGNAKLYRRTCGGPCAEIVYEASLGLYLVRGCPESPEQRGALCRAHAALRPQRELSKTIAKHRMVQPLSPMSFLELEVQIEGCIARWQPACTVSAPRGETRTRGPGKHGTLDSQRVRYCREDGQQVCWVLDRCDRDTQRYAFFVMRNERSVRGTVHDDNCHEGCSRGRTCGKKMSCPCDWGSPEFHFVIDRPHSRGHVDPVCRAECFPDVERNATWMNDRSVNQSIHTSPPGHTRSTTCSAGCASSS